MTPDRLWYSDGARSDQLSAITVTGVPVPIRHYKDLIAWQRGIDLAIACYGCTTHFPSHERFALTQQIRRAAVSVPSNIAEGQGRFHRGEFLYQLSVSRGSLQEVETLFVIADRLEYVTAEEMQQVTDICAEEGKLLAGLKRSLK
jgi:four helix bundle protein